MPDPIMPTCPVHPTVELRCPACQGARGGAVTSPTKATAARTNLARGRSKRQARTRARRKAMTTRATESMWVSDAAPQTASEIEATTIVTDAIEQSVREGRTVTIGYDDNRGGRCASALAARAEGDVETDGIHEFWGRDEHGDGWRVSVCTADAD